MSTVATINDLPTELLEEIFKNAVLTPHPDWGHKAECRRKTAVAISHVDRRWRDISLDLSRLWAGSVDATASPKCIETFVSRSCTKNLNVSMDALLHSASDYNSEPSNLKNPRSFFASEQWRVLRKTHALKRCDEMTITLHDKDRAYTWSFEKYVNAYGVRSLSVISAESPITFYLPNLGNFGSNQAFSLKLQTLRLEGCTMDLAYCAASLVNLGELSVKNVPIEYAYDPVSWLRVLVRLPSLRRLTLANGFGDKLVKYDSQPDSFFCETTSGVAKFFTHAKKRSFQLPQLQSIFIEDDTDDIADFLRWLDLPEQCAIGISIRNYVPNRVVKIQNIMRRFSKRYIRPKCPTRKLHIEMGKSTINMTSVSTRKNSNASFRLWVTWPSGTARYSGWKNAGSVLAIILGHGLEKNLKETAAFIELRMDIHDQKNKSLVLNAIQQYSPQFQWC